MVVLSTPAVANATTILRVKRPRGVDPIPTLQFSGTRKKRARSIQNLSDQLASADISNHDCAAATANTSASLIWKRVGTSNSATNKRSFKYVDATLNPIDDSSKRQRLTLEQPSITSTSSTPSTSSSSGKKKKRHTTAILDPISRLLTDRLKKVQDGSATLQSYLTFLEQDDRVRRHISNYLAFAIPNDGSNVLHLAALWNGVEEARHVLLTYPTIVPTILDAHDGNGQRPYQIALLAGNSQVAAVLEAFGADTHDYVYDVFELLPATPEEHSEQSTSTTAPATTTTVVELHGGVGYLNEHGELILEALCSDDYEQDSDKERDGDDDDVDSNAEDYEFNDYPDEEEDDDDDNSDDQEDDTTNFRHSGVYDMSKGTAAVVAPPPGGGGESYPNDDDAAEYDAQYGIYNDSDGGEDGEGRGTQRFYAYDPEFD